MIIQSEIKTVTVYKDRALIERLAQQSLKSGEHKVTFAGLPVGIDANSVQVSGSEQAVLQDIKVNDVFLDEIPDAQKKAIIEEMEELEILIEEINDRINNTNEEKALLQSLANVSPETPKKSILALLVPGKMQEILSFYNEKLNALDDTNRTNKQELKKLEKRLNILKLNLNRFNQNQLKAEKQVELKLFVKEDANINIVISYIVMDAAWKPIYDFRLNSDEKKLSIAYNAIITQNTGEKWNNVKLNLSTARPQISANTPMLNPWYINFFQYHAPPRAMRIKAKKESNFEGVKMKSEAISGIMMAEEAYAEVPMEIEDASVETGATSVIFSIPGNNTITDNNEEHKLGITNLDFDADLEYNSVPKLSPFAYLTVSASNTSDFPMLAGNTNIFLDNSFVANSSIKLIAPNEEFKTSLGVDEGIKIEHKLINKFSKDEGLFSKKNKIAYEYKIIVINNRKSESKINIKDQIPISQNQDIKIELIEPKYKEDSENLKKAADNSIEWITNLKPTEKLEINFKFSVEFPKDKELTGLL